jgi:1,4-dihydroxy-2-naphthoate polyprenyltransferase
VATTSEWIQGARPRTLPAAFAPVAVGAGIAVGAGAFNATRSLLALIVAVALQIGVNYSNDYSDGIRGTDRVRVGPVRLVGQGLARPQAVKRAAFIFFAIAMLAGTVLVVLTEQWWLFAVGAASVAAAWFYTGGSRPYGYAGLGEVFVFIFFGVVPVMGTAYVQTFQLNAVSLWAGIGVGALACSILIANNLRDIPGDTEHGKKTLAVRLGDPKTRTLFYATVALGFVVPMITAVISTPFALMAFLAAPLAISPIRAVARGARGPELIPVLKSTGILLLFYGITFGVGLGFAHTSM